MAKRKNALEILTAQVAANPELERMVEEERFNGQVAELVYQARKRAGLTQAQLGKLVGTSQSVIARLEDADYDGHSLTMLRRVAKALHLPLVLRLGDETRELQPA
jgi:ribosome-binding protein aMBF1 (putative translation factor)